jgi:hypothetical protein
MSRNIIVVLMYHRHKLLDLTYEITLPYVCQYVYPPPQQLLNA